MNARRRLRSVIVTALGALGLSSLSSLSTVAHAQLANTNRHLGFELNRYEPSAAGEWSFWVDHPWYNAVRGFAGGLTLNYAHRPLVLSDGTSIDHRLMGHLDLAGAVFDRLLLSASVPVVFLERGSNSNGVDQAGLALGDVRLGARVRVFGQPYAGPISLSLGLDLWVPINPQRSGDPVPVTVGDTSVRLMPKLMLGGLTHNIMWSFSGGVTYRTIQTIGALPQNSGNSIGTEVQLGAAVKYARTDYRFAIGPEAVFSTVVIGQSASPAFSPDFSSLEVILGAHYNLARLFNIGVAGGVGLGGDIGALREPGSPDARVLLRLAYAPMLPAKPVVEDRDHDGVPDATDACPDEAGVSSADPLKHGCPVPRDSDGDGVPDERDQCPVEPAGAHPDAAQPGCPLRDSDGDGVFDHEDKCPTEAAGATPDAAQPGCPLRDSDKDGVFDSEDQCPDQAAGEHADPRRKGCPDQDRDKDGVYDGQDQCAEVPAGFNPDPARPGCPLPDRDGDQVPDALDACPDKAGAPSPDPKKNGCPGLVEVKTGQIVIKQQIFFATGKDTILKQSFPVLDAVTHTLKTLPQIRKLDVEGHTDNQGKDAYNLDLSDRRAKSVQAYLVQHGVEATRVEAHGYGPTRPIADNKTGKGRALNRRVDFKIVDPVQPAAPAQTPPAAPAQTPPAAK